MVGIEIVDTSSRFASIRIVIELSKLSQNQYKNTSRGLAAYDVTLSIE